MWQSPSTGALRETGYCISVSADTLLNALNSSWTAAGILRPVSSLPDRALLQKSILCVLFAIILLIQGSAHSWEVWRGRPSESWDEVTTYNVVRVLRGDDLGVFSYGSLSRLLEWSALEYYRYFDPDGRTHFSDSWSNQVRETFADPMLVFHAKGDLANKVYGYHRGIDDRQPIFLARQVYLAVTYLFALALGWAAIVAVGWRSVFPLMALLLLTVSPVMYAETALALPNAINTVLTFGIAFFAMLFGIRRERHWLWVSIACLALGSNFKPDILFYGAVPAIVLLLTIARDGIGAVFRTGLRAAALYIAIFVVTCPRLWIAPVTDLRVRYHQILDKISGGNGQDMRHNFAALLRFLGNTILWPAGGWVALILLGGVFLGLVVLGWRERRLSYVIATAGFAAGALGWSIIVLRNSFFWDRYLLNGWAAVLASSAIALLLASYSDRQFWRRAAFVALFAASASYTVHAVAETRTSLAMRDAYRPYENFDPAQNRNLASLAAIKTAISPEYRKTVLVDQHAYIDLRLFRLHGLEVQTINMYDLNAVIAQLPPGRYVVVFGPGTYVYKPAYYQGSEHEFSPAEERLYDAYLARLRALRVLSHFPGHLKKLLSDEPPDPADEMYVSEIGR